MSKKEIKKEDLRRKLSIATAMLLFSSHRLPGVRGWELKKRLGKKYMKIIEVLNNYLNNIGLQVKIVFEDEEKFVLNEENLEKARFYITLAKPLTISEVKGSGWRIEDVATLAIIITIISSKGGKASLSEIKDVLSTKLPKWKIESAIEKFIRKGYIQISEENIVYLGWRAKAEIDQKELLKSMLNLEIKQLNEGKNEDEKFT
ncbi:MAG: hypothetical protein QXF09_01930 [Nitrososphaerota archaeon]